MLTNNWVGGIPRLRCHPEVTSHQTVPDKSNLWSDHPRPKYPLIRFKWARNTVCAQSVLETVSNQTSDQTKISPLSRRLCNHGPKQTQTIVQKIVHSKSLLIKLLCAQKSLLIRLLWARNHLWSNSIDFFNFVIVYSFHKNWCLHYQIHLKKRPF